MVSTETLLGIFFYPIRYRENIVRQIGFIFLVDLYYLFDILMITETRTRLFHTSERYPHRRHHTLDNATLDKFNFICVPLHSNEVNFLCSQLINYIN